MRREVAMNLSGHASARRLIETILQTTTPQRPRLACALESKGLVPTGRASAASRISPSSDSAIGSSPVRRRQKASCFVRTLPIEGWKA